MLGFLCVIWIFPSVCVLGLKLGFSGVEGVVLLVCFECLQWAYVCAGACVFIQGTQRFTWFGLRPTPKPELRREFL